MARENSLPLDEHACPLQVEVDQAPSTRGVVSRKSTRILHIAPIFAALTLVAVAAWLWLPNAQETSSHQVAFNPVALRAPPALRLGNTGTVSRGRSSSRPLAGLRHGDAHAVFRGNSRASARVEPRSSRLTASMSTAEAPSTQLSSAAGLAAVQASDSVADEHSAKFDSYVTDEMGQDYAIMLEDMRAVFDSGRTKDVEWRRDQLEKLILGMQENADQIVEAISADMGGGQLRGLFDTVAIQDAKFALANLNQWTKPTPVASDMPFDFKSSFYVRPEPKGVTLNIGPWNYPFNLCLQPLVAAIAAGNCMVIKPSEMAPNSAIVIERIVTDYLDNDAVKVVQGGRASSTALLAQHWDHIFYTGNGAVGRIVLEAAAKHLTPVTLELGGKNPVLVDSTADMDAAVNRIFYAKWTNQGQTCVAPDFVIIDETRKEEFITKFADQIKASGFGEGSLDNPTWGKIINKRHAERLKRLIDTSGGEVVIGGAAQVDVDAQHVPMTVIKDVDLNAPIMSEEIFGPVLPVISVSNMDDAIKMVKRLEKPLALYVFSEDEAFQERALTECTSGGACVNTAFEHIVNKQAPFGGVGESGMGRYHGKYGFDEFSHLRTVLYKKGSDPALPHPENTPGWFYKLLRTVLVGK